MKAKISIGLLAVFFLLFLGACGDNNAELTDKRDNLTGSWHVVLDDGESQMDYQSDITKDSSNTDKIYMSNFIANNHSAYGTLSGLAITVPQQTVGNSIVTATGNISSDYQTITWSVTIDGDSYTATFTPGGITKDMIVQ